MQSAQNLKAAAKAKEKGKKHILTVAQMCVHTACNIALFFSFLSVVLNAGYHFTLQLCTVKLFNLSIHFHSRVKHNNFV